MSKSKLKSMTFTQLFLIRVKKSFHKRNMIDDTFLKEIHEKNKILQTGHKSQPLRAKRAYYEVTT